MPMKKSVRTDAFTAASKHESGDFMILKLYEFLLKNYGAQHWWPCRSGERWEIIAGAILTQNCAWHNVELALNRLAAASLDTPLAVLNSDRNVLEQAVQPAGFFRQKSSYLRDAAAFFVSHGTELMTESTPQELQRKRRLVLSCRGIGRETADSILLYAFGQPIFVIDAYTRRVVSRHLGWDGNMHYDDLQTLISRRLPRDVRVFQEYHALLVRHCKESCRKSGCGHVCARWNRGE